MITGGLGFIGTNFIKYILEKKHFAGSILNVDNLSYSGNMINLEEVKRKYKDRYFFEKVNICNYKKILKLFAKYDIDTVVHFAAESHVDRSIHYPRKFIDTNIIGTYNLLEAAFRNWQNRNDVVFHHISTDEVFGSLDEDGHFSENSIVKPRSPYSASKASSDHFVHAYHYTFGLPITISHCSNNYGPYQHPEKLIPFMLLNMINNAPLPIYGDGKNIRDWIYVDDHSEAIWTILNNGKTGESYNIGGNNEWCNIDLVTILCEVMAALMKKDREYYKKNIVFVKDRLGHDRRYAIDSTKIQKELKWYPHTTFLDGINETVRWYLDNRVWIKKIQNNSFRNWLTTNYK